MPFLLAIQFLGLVALAVGASCYALLVMQKISSARRRYPTLASRAAAPMPGPAAGSNPERPWPKLVVVVPAHNEADVIAEVAGSVLRADYPALHAIFALDRCTDATQAVLMKAIDDARAAGHTSCTVQVLPITACPEGWAGKVHALHHAVQQSEHAASAEALLFLDADCQLDPACLRAAVSLWREHDLDLLSALSTLIAEHWYEKVVQPIAAFELVRQYPVARVNADFALLRDPATGLLRGSRRAWPFANGQFILVRRAAYDALGGHECVKAELLEDIALAKRFARARYRIGVFLSGGPLRCRMYRSWEAFGRGWKRIYTEAAKRRPNRLRSNLRAVLATQVVFPLAGPLCALAALPALLLGDRPLALACALAGALATALCQLMAARVFSTQGLPTPMPWTIARGGWHTAAILRAASRDLLTGAPTEWGGKRYQRTPNLDQVGGQPSAPRGDAPEGGPAGAGREGEAS
jgi:glycosyltransferase involved in cell wall biosynthesis